MDATAKFEDEIFWENLRGKKKKGLDKTRWKMQVWWATGFVAKEILCIQYLLLIGDPFTKLLAASGKFYWYIFPLWMCWAQKNLICLQCYHQGAWWVMPILCSSGHWLFRSFYQEILCSPAPRRISSLDSIFFLFHHPFWHLWYFLCSPLGPCVKGAI